MKQNRSTKSVTAVILLLPFVVFYWKNPIWPDRNIGQDYVLYAPMYQMELMLSIKSGSFPLYAPGFFGGQSASALTMGEIYHPTAHLSAVMPGYWHGFALKWNTFFRLASLGLAHLAVFAFIRKFPLRIWAAFLFSTITVYNMRTLLLFNYGSALETWTGFLVLCSGVGLYAFHPGTRRYPLLIIGAGYWMIASGHPQMMYYGVLGALGTALLMPFFVHAVLPAHERHGFRAAGFWLRTGLCLIAAIALASAYILPFYFDFVTTNAGRADQGYAWAAAYHDTLAGTLNNLFNPLRAGTSMFGGTPFFLLAAILPLMRLTGMRIPPVIWGLWGVLLLLFLHLQGPRLPIHHLAWKYLPFASTFREPGRIAMLIPFPAMLLLVWATASPAAATRIRIRRISFPAPVLAALTASMLMAVYVLLPRHFTAHPQAFCPLNTLQVPPWVEITSLSLSGVILFAWMIAGWRHFQTPATGALICILTIANLVLFFRHGIWIDQSQPTPTYTLLRAEKEDGLYYRPHPGEGYKHRAVVRQLRKSFLEPRLGKVFYRFETAANNDEAYRRMAFGRSIDLVVIENLPPELLADTPAPSMTYAARKETDRVDLVYSSFNRLVFRVASGEPAFFGLGYPYTGHWKTFINDHPTALFRANGAAHAVRVPAGVSHVEFRYHSRAATWGMAFSMAAYGILGAAFGWKTRRSLPGKIRIAAPVALAVVGFMLWHQSLYKGENLETRYHWRPPPEKVLTNLAYGKPAQISRHVRFHPYFYGAGRGVDGDRHTPYGFVTKGSCFITGRQEYPWWRVDLGRVETVAEIHMYLSLQGGEWNRLPFILAVSEDGVEWKGAEHHRLTSPGKLAVTFPTPLSIRYVQIMASGYGRLALDEIEIYPPGNSES